MKAFILISLNEIFSKGIIDELQKYPQIEKANFIFGEWDIIAEVNVSNSEELYTFVIDSLRSREDIKLTSSLIVAGMS
ncbi:MAG: Lrp/AsnC ligand binding domain-containing protein [Nanoarchaeota archaeon]|nr:Lrp/AsnC ligand binding domain-containing protein [Nanoarchaeota archaeon]MBU1632667.1 Lrp/AsnC ligand binding domain-containing protein [Nanoarchaeota archaeon]MBU1875552.1 Lrp/AsnC ligand binding domain-containing protein [Nanoarchaeota archaeon]